MNEKIHGWMTGDLSNAIDRIAARLAAARDDERIRGTHVHDAGHVVARGSHEADALLNVVDGLPTQVRDEVLRRFERRG